MIMEWHIFLIAIPMLLSIGIWLHQYANKKITQKHHFLCHLLIWTFIGIAASFISLAATYEHRFHGIKYTEVAGFLLTGICLIGIYFNIRYRLLSSEKLMRAINLLALFFALFLELIIILISLGMFDLFFTNATFVITYYIISIVIGLFYLGFITSFTIRFMKKKV